MERGREEWEGGGGYRKRGRWREEGKSGKEEVGIDRGGDGERKGRVGRRRWV